MIGPTLCQGKKKNGDPCGSPPRSSGPSAGTFCVWHDPTVSKETKAKWAQAGGLSAQYPAMALAKKKAEVAVALETLALPPLASPTFLDEVAQRIQSGMLPVSVAEQLRRLHDSKREDRSLDLAWAIFQRLQSPEMLLLLAKAKEGEGDGD